MNNKFTIINKGTHLYKLSIWCFLITLLFSLNSCGNAKQSKTSMGPQPKLDSVSIVKVFNAIPAFKDQTLWAKSFYRERDFQLGWFKNHTIVPEAKQLLDVINRAGEEGLNPKDYQIKDFSKLFAGLEAGQSDSVKRNELEKEIDLSLTGTYLNWASDYYRGIVIPTENKEIEWDVKRNKIKLHKALMTFLKERESKYSYAEFKPLHIEYSYLKEALKKHRQIQAAGGWPKIPANTKLKTGQTSPVVVTLRKRLMIASDSAASDSSKYDEPLVSAVKNFQEQNGLKPSGLVGPETINLLNVPVEQRIQQIIINMERWRWLPKSFEPDYLLVNIPEYTLHVIEKGKEVLNMKVITGKVLNSTPIFSDKMETVVLSPYWNVPMSIIIKEFQPKLINNPNYLEHLDMEIIDNKKNVISASSIDWASISESNFKYTIRRRPGPKNDLGDVKFIFPNTNDVYLHDTPHDELFNQSKRSFSHGCVRVEQPIKLAEYLLRNKPGWDKSNILNTISLRKEKHVALKEKLPVYLVYFTAWADAEGNMHFREDIYGHDKKLASEYFSKIF